MRASSQIVSGSFFGGNIEDGTFHGEEFAGGFCCGDQPYTEADLRTSTESLITEPVPTYEVDELDPSFIEQEVLVAA